MNDEAPDIPMFPLATVLLPSVQLPLHVFEPRYREMARVCTAGTPEFGVVLIERGSEVGGRDVRRQVGCMARIVEAAELPDGRWVLATVGTERFRVERWLPDAPYPRAEVSLWPDPPPGPDAQERRTTVLARLRRALAMCAELGDPAPDATVEVVDDPVEAGYQMAALAPLGPADRYQLLAAFSPAERYRLLERMLDDELAVLAHRMTGG